MRVPRFLKALIVPLIIVTAIRFYNDAGPLQLFELFNELQNFDWNVSALTELLNDFVTAVGNNESYTWQQDISVFENIFLLVQNVVNRIGTVFRLLTQTLGSLFDQIALIFQKVFKVILLVLGF